jgi:predicted anti-sigma-YlaC factor YlaD
VCPLVLLSEDRESAADEGVCCALARETLSAALDGEASVPEIVAAARHLRGCQLCRRFAVQMAAATRDLRSVQLDRTSSLKERARGRSG